MIFRTPIALVCLVMASPAAAVLLAPNETPAFNAWLRGVQLRVIRSVQASHGFPRSARVSVDMFVNPDGSVGDVHAVSSSDADPHYPALATRVVRLAGPFPPEPPSASHRNGVQINVPIKFNVPYRGRRHRRH